MRCRMMAHAVGLYTQILGGGVHLSENYYKANYVLQPKIPTFAVRAD